MEKTVQFASKYWLRAAVVGLWSLFSNAQAPLDAPPTSGRLILQGVELAEKRQCDEALPLLKEHTARASDEKLKYRAEMAIVRCAIHKKDGKETVSALLGLKHDYPKDPEVLYLTAHIFLEIAVQASKDLSVVAPGSYQVTKLHAESLESENKWEEAIAVYREILAADPKLPEIHLKLGRALLALPPSSENTRDARGEFQAELTIDPTNGVAEFWIGELDRLDGRLDDAITHFRSAAKLDPALAVPLLGLGIVFNAAGRYSDALAPLETYTQLAPDDPAGHFQLARAFAFTDRKEDSARELAIHRKLSASELAPSESTAVPPSH